MFLALHPAGLRHGHWRSTASASAAGRSEEVAWTPWTCGCSPSGPWPRTRFIFRRDGSDRALIVDPGDEADKLLRRDRGAGREARRDPAHAHALRPRGRGGAGGARPPGAEVWVPEIEKLRARRHQRLRARGPASGRSSPMTPSTRSRAARSSSWPASRSTCIFTPGHSPGHVTFSIPDEQAVFSGRRAVPGLGRPHRPARRRLAHAARVDPRAGRLAARRDARSTPATWASRRSAPSARPTRSWPSWRGSADGEAPGPAGDVRRRCPRTAGAARRLAPRDRRAARRAPATSRSRRRCSRTPSCSRAAWASPPTSSRRRCSPSRTRPAGR